MEQVAIGSIEENDSVGTVELHGKLLEGSNSLQGQGVFLGVVDIAAREWGSLAGESGVDEFRDGSKERGGAQTTRGVFERTHGAI